MGKIAELITHVLIPFQLGKNNVFLSGAVYVGFFLLVFSFFAFPHEAKEELQIDCGCGVILKKLVVNEYSKDAIEFNKAQNKRRQEKEDAILADLLRNNHDKNEAIRIWEELRDEQNCYFKGVSQNIEKDHKLSDKDKETLKQKTTQSKAIFEEIVEILTLQKGCLSKKYSFSSKNLKNWCETNSGNLKKLCNLMKREKINVIGYFPVTKDSEDPLGQITLVRANDNLLICFSANSWQNKAWSVQLESSTITLSKEKPFRLSNNSEINAREIWADYFISASILRNYKTYVTIGFIEPQEEEQKLATPVLLADYASRYGLIPQATYEVKTYNRK